MKKILFIMLLHSAVITCSKSQPVAIALHGGAGTISRESVTPEKEKAYKDKMTEALQVGYEVLNKGGTSVDAVEAVIKILEDSPMFNAGRGSVFTAEGTNELDAAIMDGKDLSAGSVAGVKTIKNPISAARKVMENSPHVMMTGAGAEKFAKEQGLKLVDPSYFYTEERYQELQKIKAREAEQLKQKGELSPADINHKFGTVGCVALDKHGNIAAGTSTGGMTNKKFGRVGDAPIIGAGTYANNNSCAVSATGHGEYFIRATAAHDIAALMEYKGMNVQDAAQEVVMNKLETMGGKGGVIAIDKKGIVAIAFNTTGMYHGYINTDGKLITGIFK